MVRTARFMLLLTWLVVWTRQRELRTVREELPAYAAAGWITPAEPFALGSMRARRLARVYAGRHLGRPAARVVAQYEAYATSLAFLRHRGFVTPEDVKAIAFDVLRHRIAMTYEAEAEELTQEKIIQRVFDRVEVP